MQLRKLFDQFDTDNDGIISYEEFEAAMKKMDYPPQQMHEIFESIVSDTFLNAKLLQGNAQLPPHVALFLVCRRLTITDISCTQNSSQLLLRHKGEFEATLSIAFTVGKCLMTACSRLYRHIEEERLAEAFDRLDSDDSGFISKQNLRDFLGKKSTNEMINQIINEGDTDHDGKSK